MVPGEGLRIKNKEIKKKKFLSLRFLSPSLASLEGGLPRHHPPPLPAPADLRLFQWARPSSHCQGLEMNGLIVKECHSLKSQSLTHQSVVVKTTQPFFEIPTSVESKRKSTSFSK